MTGIKLKSKLAIICALLLTFSFAACGGNGNGSGSEYIISSTAGSNGSISPDGATVVNSGSNQTFTITPNTDYHVSDVLVDGLSVGAVTTYTFSNVKADHTISASFSNSSPEITATAGANGSISPSGTVAVDNGADQDFTISADMGYYVSDVLVDGMSVGAVTTYTFTNVTANHTIAASFATGPRTITASASANGSISPSGSVTVNPGDDQTFTITADAGYYVSDVLVDGVSVGAVTTYIFANVTADHTIAASFSENPHTITATSGSNGSISPSGSVAVNPGDDQTFTITADAGYYVSDVLVDGVSIDSVTTYTFNNVTADHTIAVSFGTGPLTITATSGANGSISPSGAVTVNPGDDQPFTFNPDGNYDVLDVFVDGVSVGALPGYTFTNVTTDHTISVTFATNTITASAGSNGSISPSGDVTVGNGEDKTFIFTPDTYYHVSDVLVDGVPEGAITSYTFTNVTADHTIEAIFEHDPIYVTMGDSITEGTGDDIPSDGIGYPPRLEDLLNAQGNGIPYTVINEGVGGTESWEGKDLVHTLITNHPESTHFLVQYGTNDSPPGDPLVPSGKGLNLGDPGYPGTFKDNMQQIIDAVTNADKNICLAKIPIALGDTVDSTPYPIPDNGNKNTDPVSGIKEYNEVIDELVIMNNILVTPPDFYNYFNAIDTSTGNRRYVDQYADNDNLHPNGEGYRSMAQLWFNALTQ